MVSAPQPIDESATITLRVERLAAWYGNHQVLRNVDLDIAAGQVTAIIGPSGCGKSTLIRCLNRLHETTPGGRVAGRVLLHGEDIYAADADPVLVRRRVGMVFQRANPFPTLSIFDNVAAGVRLNGLARGEELKSVMEESLRQAALWDEVKDQLSQPGIATNVRSLDCSRRLRTRGGEAQVEAPKGRVTGWTESDDLRHTVTFDDGCGFRQMPHPDRGRPAAERSQTAATLKRSVYGRQRALATIWNDNPGVW